MEILLLGIYAFFVWLIFIKFKWLPWNIVSQVICFIIPVVALSVLMLCLNIYAPASGDTRAMNYVVQVVPRVTGRVIEVPVEPNRPVKKGDVLFKLDPVPFELEVKAAEANLTALRAKLITAEANQRSLVEQLKNATASKEALAASLALTRRRLEQFTQLARTGAGTKFDEEQARSDVLNFESQLAALAATESQIREKLAAKTPEGEQDEVAQAKAAIAQAEAQLGSAKWNLEQTVYYAPADGRVINLQLREGSVAAQLPMLPVMSFVEDEQWLLGMFYANELHKVEPGNEVEISMKMYPGRIIKCKVDSIVWATGEGQMPLGGQIPNMGATPLPQGRIAVKFKPDGKDADVFLSAGARGRCAIYTHHGTPIQILRRVILRVNAKLDWLIIKHVPSGH